MVTPGFYDNLSQKITTGCRERQPGTLDPAPAGMRAV